ncbi:TrmB family transcriptional regulator [Streptomyces sp. CC228A]|uniref:TrmB family transcriptional regulator n=1 Tax=Streptomyces sp. CC228A TaxID=2898186 RepID=UPI001F47AC61|nr:helix-turn-helix domain-containing protein [Streptomyces sp. CC228A]
MIQGEWPPLGLGEAEERAYEALLLERAHGVEELARLLDLPQKQVHTALDRLVEHGFARPAGPPDGAGLPHPTAPETALHTLIHRRQAELHRRSAELARLRLTAERLAAAAGTGPGQASGPVGGVEAVSGARAIAERAGELVAGAEREVLVMDDRPHVAWLDLAAARAAEGLPVRVVLGGPGLGCPAGQRRAAALADRGLRLRAAAAGVPTRLVAVDGRVALLPPAGGAAPGAYALLVAEARLRDALLPLFEAVWSGATPPDRPG